MRVRIDPDKCIASGACVLAQPKVFAQDEDGIVWLLKDVPDADEEAATVEAMHACPAMVIEIDEA